MFFQDLLTYPLTQSKLSVVLIKCSHITEELLRDVFKALLLLVGPFLFRFDVWFGLIFLQSEAWNWVSAVLWWYAPML